MGRLNVEHGISAPSSFEFPEFVWVTSCKVPASAAESMKKYFLQRLSVISWVILIFSDGKVNSLFSVDNKAKRCIDNEYVEIQIIINC